MSKLCLWHPWEFDILPISFPKPAETVLLKGGSLSREMTWFPSSFLPNTGAPPRTQATFMSSPAYQIFINYFFKNCLKRPDSPLRITLPQWFKKHLIAQLCTTISQWSKKASLPHHMAAYAFLSLHHVILKTHQIIHFSPTSSPIMNSTWTQKIDSKWFKEKIKNKDDNSNKSVKDDMPLTTVNDLMLNVEG